MPRIATRCMCVNAIRNMYVTAMRNCCGTNLMRCRNNAYGRTRGGENRHVAAAGTRRNVTKLPCCPAAKPGQCELCVTTCVMGGGIMRLCDGAKATNSMAGGGAIRRRSDPGDRRCATRYYIINHYGACESLASERWSGVFAGLRIKRETANW